MNINNKKYEFLNNLIVVSMLVYLFFLSRRGGNTKDIISIFIMFLIFIYSFKNGIKGYLMHKRDIIISVIYLILVSISYIIVDEKGNDKFYVFSHATIFSIGFMLVLLNYKLNNKYVKYILPILLLISISPIYKGIIDVYEHLDVIISYRIVGNTSTPKYAAELVIYLFLGLFSFIYYRNIYIKIILACYTITVLILVFFTQSRGSFLAIPATIILIFTILDWKKGLLAVIITFALMFSLFKYTSKTDKVRVVNRIESSIMTKEKIKKDARFTIFSDGIKEAKNYPIIGKGFFFYKGQKLHSADENIDHYHNNFIETAVTQGLLTLSVYIIFLINLFMSMLKNYLKENNRLKKYIKLFTISTFVFINFYGLIEVSFYFEKIYQLVFTIIAISFIIDNKDSIDG
ncbi:O-antigen ligase family protein [Fusobacterium canifelinum]|uniref:O-antigen ligase family protein n=1 Tax=Fusobacterium canifelinum TaxID=285729 RepID=A0A3P1UYC1_9FUSO|nr:O-antigen ligase family protein [Fusobacterium canifelinum]QQB72912.1 O-antigen ligase family protein [Fusobacterium canifelinum]RRD26648.1 O-antigen ligase family protein [Fusobacterium canifelinum]